MASLRNKVTVCLKLAYVLNYSIFCFCFCLVFTLYWWSPGWVGVRYFIFKISNEVSSISVTDITILKCPYYLIIIQVVLFV